MEIWKYIEGYGDKYSISSYGNIKRNYVLTKWGTKVKSQTPIKIHKDRNGYLRCDLIQYGGKRKGRLLHRLVAKAFLSNPLNYKEINHIDGNKENNKVTNLEWCTRAYNIRHAVDTGLWKPKEGVNHFRSKPVMQIDPTTKEIIKVWDSVNMATRALGGKRSYGGSHIWDVIKGKRHTCFGYEWKLFDKKSVETIPKGSRPEISTGRSAIPR